MTLLNWSHVHADRSYLYLVSAPLFIGLILSVYSVVYVMRVAFYIAVANIFSWTAFHCCFSC